MLLNRIVSQILPSFWNVILPTLDSIMEKEPWQNKGWSVSSHYLTREHKINVGKDDYTELIPHELCTLGSHTHGDVEYG